MADDRLHDLYLDRFWDGLVRGDRGDAGGGVDPEEAAAVRAFQRLADAPLPAAARTTDWRAVKARVNAQRLEEDVMATVAQWQSGPPSLARNGRLGPGGPPSAGATRRRPVRWASGQFATVLLLLVTLLFGYLAHRGSRPAAIPPVQDIPTVETLVDVTIAGEAIMAGSADDWTDFYLGRAVVRPGRPVVIERDAVCCPGPDLQYVLSGTLVVSVDGPMMLRRAGAPADVWDRVPAGQKTTLTAGDAIVYSLDRPLVLAAAGADPVELLFAGAFAGIVSGVPVTYGVLFHVEDYPMTPLPPGPVRLLLRRVTLPPDAALPPYAPLPRELLLVNDGVILRQAREPGAGATPPPGGTLVVGQGIVAGDLAEGTVLAIWNEADHPATLYLVSLEPAGAQAATAVGG